jgi:aryl-alcohol dehydrogenase-like predicted oxidoreductase
LNKALSSRIGLGTVQFGLDYGISNTHGQLTGDTVKELLQIAVENHIDTLDTAHGYGDAEKVLGNTGLASVFSIVSKIPAGVHAPGLREAFRESLNRLGVDGLYGLLFHDFSTWQADEKLWDILAGMRAEGTIQKAGFSLYYPQQLEKLLDRGIPFDLVQLPYNIFDRRFEPFLETLSEKGVEVHIRSVFLQGIFFLKEDTLRKKFGDKIAYDVWKIKNLALENAIPVHALLLNLPLQNPFISKVIIGVEGPQTLRQNIAALEFYDKVANISRLLEPFASSDENLLLPFNWKK